MKCSTTAERSDITVFFGHSMLSLFGWWVAWVYALSLALLWILPRGSSPDDPRFRDWAAEIRFVSSGFSLVESDVNGLLGLKAVLTQPAPLAMDVPVEVRPATAKEGIDYRVAPAGATVLFAKGATEGTLRLVRERGLDVVPIDDDIWTGARSLRLRLLGNAKVVAAGDTGLCTVTIQDDEPAPQNLIPIRFVKSTLDTTERELCLVPIEVQADAAVASQTPVEFQLFRSGAAGRQSLGSFQRVLAPGDRRIALRLEDVLGQGDLKGISITDDRLPGPDDSYELELLAPPPLFPADPSMCRIIASNDDPAPQTRVVYFDETGREISYLDPNGSLSVELAGEPLETESRYEVAVNGTNLSDAVVVPAGRSRGKPVRLGRCGLGDLRGRRCDVAIRCRSGCCPGQKGASRRSVVGVPVPGDALVVLVNNERLHERGDRIVDEVQAVLDQDAINLYDSSVFVLNRDGEDRLTVNGGRPHPGKAFRPFGASGDDVAGQLRRIEEFVSRKREGAEREDLRAVVIWPERDLTAGDGLTPTGGGSAPISFLLPDADRASTHGFRRGLVPENAVPGSVTVRCPPAHELDAHLRNVLDHALGQSAGRDGPSERPL